MPQRTLFFVLLATLLSVLPAWAQDNGGIVELDGEDGVQRIESYIQFLADDDGEISFDDALASDFEPVGEGAYILKGQSWVWLHVTLRNVSDRPLDRIVEIDTDIIDHIDTYLVSEDQTTGPILLGEADPISGTPLPSRRPRLPLHLDPGEELDVYLHVQNIAGTQVPIRIGPASDILLEEQRFLYINGSILGFSILMLGMSVLLYYHLRTRVFLLLALMTLLLFPIRIRGLGIVKIFFDDGISLYFLNQGAMVFVYIARVAYILFIAELVGVHLKQGWHRYVVFVYMAVSLLMGLDTAVHGVLPDALAPALQFSAQATNVGLAVILGHLAWQKNRVALTMFIAVLTSEAFLYAGKALRFGDLPLNSFTAHLGVINIWVFHMFLLVALALYARSADQSRRDALAKSDEEAHKSQRLQQTLGRYFSDEVMDTLMADDGKQMQGQERWVTVLFSDLASYSTIIEPMSPKQVVTLLNSYLGAMQEVIENHQGVVLEYIGDAILVVFGAPGELEDHQEHAVRCAVDMRKTLEHLNATWHEQGMSRFWKNRGIETMQCRIGLHTGSVVAGNLGSERYMKYGIVGDAVNIAARLEQKNKDLGTTILLSAEVQASLPIELAETLTDQGTMALKGREQGKRIYSI